MPLYMINLIRKLLVKIIEDIDADNSELNEDESVELLEYISEITNKNEKLSKYQACKYLKMSRATFDKYVSKGKIPKGRKQQGFKELFYFKKDLDKIKNK